MFLSNTTELTCIPLCPRRHYPKVDSAAACKNHFMESHSPGPGSQVKPMLLSSAEILFQCSAL